jgi:hypothetical protein
MMSSKRQLKGYRWVQWLCADAVAESVEWVVYEETVWAREGERKGGRPAPSLRFSDPVHDTAGARPRDRRPTHEPAFSALIGTCLRR